MMSGEAGNIPGLDSILRGEIMRKDALVNQLLNQNKEVHTEILAHLGIPSSPDPSLGRSMCSAHISHWMVWGWYVWLEHSCSCSLEAFLFAKKSKESIQTSGISLSSFCSPVGEEFLIQSKYSDRFSN